MDPQESITSFIIIIATFVTIADFSRHFCRRFTRTRGFVAPIVANCLILGRQEAGSRNTPGLAVMDALGWCWSLALLGAVEILGNGSLFGLPLRP